MHLYTLPLFAPRPMHSRSLPSFVSLFPPTACAAFAGYRRGACADFVRERLYCVIAGQKMILLVLLLGAVAPTALADNYAPCARSLCSDYINYVYFNLPKHTTPMECDSAFSGSAR